MTTKQKLILFLISCDPGIKDIYKLAKVFERFEFPANIEVNLNPLLEAQLIIPTKWYNDNLKQPLAYAITTKGKTYLDQNFDNKEVIDYLTAFPSPGILLEITKSYIEKRQSNNNNEF